MAEEEGNPLMRHYQRRRKRRPPAGFICGLLFILAGSHLVMQHRATTEAYATLAEQVVTDRACPIEGGSASTSEDKQSHDSMDVSPVSDSTPTLVDWDTLHQSNTEVVAWVQVDGTDISLPVMQPADGDMSFYLSHDFWRNPSAEGVPFLDHRSSPDGIHRMVYGHHHTMGGQFSSLQLAYQQEVFNTLGSCLWTTAKCGTTTLVPLCALKVDMWFEDIQRFAFGDDTEVDAWLGDIAEISSARSDSWCELASSARSVTTLVTCSSQVAGKQWRTLVLFVEVPR